MSYLKETSLPKPLSEYSEKELFRDEEDLPGKLIRQMLIYARANQIFINIDLRKLDVDDLIKFDDGLQSLVEKRNFRKAVLQEKLEKYTGLNSLKNSKSIKVQKAVKIEKGKRDKLIKQNKSQRRPSIPKSLPESDLKEEVEVIPKVLKKKKFISDEKTAKLLDQFISFNSKNYKLTGAPKPKYDTFYRNEFTGYNDFDHYLHERRDEGHVIDLVDNDFSISSILPSGADIKRVEDMINPGIPNHLHNFNLVHRSDGSQRSPFIIGPLETNPFKKGFCSLIFICRSNWYKCLREDYVKPIMSFHQLCALVQDYNFSKHPISLYALHDRGSLHYTYADHGPIDGIKPMFTGLPEEVLGYIDYYKDQLFRMLGGRQNSNSFREMGFC